MISFVFLFVFGLGMNVPSAYASLDKANILANEIENDAGQARDLSERAANSNTLEEAQDFARQARDAAESARGKAADIKNEIAQSQTT